MEVAIILAVVAVILFGVEFVRSLSPTPNWTALGLLFFALSFAVYLWEVSDGLKTS